MADKIEDQLRRAGEIGAIDTAEEVIQLTALFKDFSENPPTVATLMPVIYRVIALDWEATEQGFVTWLHILQNTCSGLLSTILKDRIAFLEASLHSEELEGHGVEAKKVRLDLDGDDDAQLQVAELMQLIDLAGGEVIMASEVDGKVDKSKLN
jgi:hypothetical protein